MFKALNIIIITIALSSLIGCHQYWERRDTVSLGVGDAVAANKVTHTENPWPPEARRKQYNANGERMHLAIKRYKKNKSVEPRDLGSDASSSESSQSTTAKDK